MVSIRDLKSRYMLRKAPSTLLFILISTLLLAQNPLVEKKMNKVRALLDKGNTEKAVDQLEKVLEDNSTYGKGWDLLTKIKQQRWQNMKGMRFNFGGDVTVEVKGDSDEDAEELGEQIMAMLTNMSPESIAHEEYINTMRRATLNSNEAYHSSMLLRGELVVVDVDTNITDKAYEYFQKAEVEFQTKNFFKAAEFYQLAIDEQADFYKAKLYLGDAYYFMENYVEAIKKFKIAKQEHPMMLEPRKYLVDAYAKESLYDQCMAEAIESFTVYPDQVTMLKLRDAAYLNGKSLDPKWMQRKCFPNIVEGETKLKKVKEEPTVWKPYVEAGRRIEEYCDQNGIITKKNNITSHRYMEVYSWEELLKNDQSPDLDIAREMKEAGYLDCYVFISCFHQDIYGQYRDFADNNSEKIISYFDLLIE